jgi:transposase
MSAKTIYDPEIRQIAKAMRKRGLAVAEIAEKLGVPLKTIYKWVGKASEAQKRRSKRESNLKRGEAARATWLPDAQRLLADGLTINEIRLRLGIAKDTAYKWLGKAKSA